MNTPTEFFVVFIGAGVGGTLRHVFNIVFRGLASGFAYETLTVNVIGSLVMGLMTGFFALKFDPGQSWRLFFNSGLLGGFTTFAAFSLDAVVFYAQGALGAMAVYVIASVTLSIAGLLAGLFIVRHFG